MGVFFVDTSFSASSVRVDDPLRFVGLGVIDSNSGSVTVEDSSRRRKETGANSFANADDRCYIFFCCRHSSNRSSRTTRFHETTSGFHGHEDRGSLSCSFAEGPFRLGSGFSDRVGSDPSDDPVGSSGSSTDRGDGASFRSFSEDSSISSVVGDDPGSFTGSHAFSTFVESVFFDGSQVDSGFGDSGSAGSDSAPSASNVSVSSVEASFSL